ncbi:MAG: DUF6259 domain-containing protein [Pirellulaceae bacterium]
MTRLGIRGTPSSAWIFPIVLWHFTGLAGWAEEAVRDDFLDVRSWIARPEWLSPHSDKAVLSAEAGIAKFEVAEPGQGMKWWRSFAEPADAELSPWLVLRYRAVNLDVHTPEYVVWLKDGGTTRDGVNLLKGDRMQADGQWHTLAINLQDAGVVARITAVAVQCFATEAGQGALYIDYLAITDLPPDDAEGIARPRVPTIEHVVDLRDAGKWIVQPAWLGNYTPHHRQTGTSRGLQFQVDDGMMGAKWSRTLDEPLVGARYLAMRYRAQNLRNWGDYILHASSADTTTGEQYVLREGELLADGQWHVAVARVTLPEIRMLAVQVQASHDNALLEIADLRFLDQKPVITLSDTFEHVPGWPTLMEGWQTVELPAGNLSGRDLMRRLGVEGWLTEDRITASGVPYQLRSGADAVVMTSVREPGEIRVPLSGRAHEAYLLMAAQFPHHDEPSYSGTAGQVRHVHRLVGRIAYTDGTREKQFPFAVNARQHAVSRGLHVYSLALDPTKSLLELTLVDAMSRGAFGLAALTLSDTSGPATEATRLRPTPESPQHLPPAIRPATITRHEDLLEIQAETIGMIFDLSRGLRVVSVTNLSGAGLEARIAPGPLFRVLVDGVEMSSEEFVVEQITSESTNHGEVTRIDLRCDKTPPPVQVRVWVDVIETREIGLRASIELHGRDPAKTSFLFPELRGLGFGGLPVESWIWCPRRGDVITAASVSLREPYAGAGNPLQIIGAFDPLRGTGLYVMTQDMQAASKFYQVQKNAHGARLAIEYTPLHDALTPRTVIGCCPGDWHAQLARYQEWVADWYQPAAPRKPWFRQVWNFRQQFMHFALPTPSGMFDAASKKIQLKEVVAADAAAFGGVDYLHLFDWGWDPVHGRCGDYEPWDYLGGVESFHRAVEEVKADGIPVGLYIEGILVDPQSLLGKAQGEQWQMTGPAGQPYSYFAPSYHICPRVPAWQEYLSDTYRRVQQQTGADGFYIDQYGFSGPTYWCYNANHGHPVPVTPVLGERDMLQQVRDKLGPDAIIYTEESPTDVNSQYQDGSFTYNISSISDDWSPSHVNLYRFAFPSFKTIEIICCDQPLGTNVEAVKRCLFNGEAIWIEGIWDQWFAPEVRAQIALNRRVLHENRQCFAGDHVQPLVPTLRAGLYANQFGQRKDVIGKTCWTVYNTHYRTVSAEVLAVEHAPGAQYLDELTGQPLQPRIEGDTAHLTLEIPPRDVVVISRGLYMQ